MADKTKKAPRGSSIRVERDGSLSVSLREVASSRRGAKQLNTVGKIRQRLKIKEVS